MRISVLLGVEQELGERLAELGLADAGRPEEQERAVRAVRIGTGPSASGGSHRTRGAPPRPGRRRARAARLPCAAACRARPASSSTPGCRSRATRPRRSPRRRPACAASCGFFACSACELRVGLLELRLELRQLAVLELGHLLPVALAPRLFHLQLDLVDLLLDVLRARDLRLLGLPDLVEVGVLALEPRDLVLDQRRGASSTPRPSPSSPPRARS